MNIILIHIGENLPSYFENCVKQIRKYFSGDIFAYIPNRNNEHESLIKNNGLIHVPEYIDSIMPRLQEFNRRSFMDREYGTFWNFAFKRLFILEEIIKEYSLKDVIHIENDVLIYSDPSKLNFSSICKTVAINPVGPKYATYAYCYIPNYIAMHNVNNANLSILDEGNKILNERYGQGMVNEMLIARELVNKDIVDILPTTTEGPGSYNFKKFNSLFDGSAWGQYVGGIPSNPVGGWKEPERYVGDALIAGKYDIVWESNSSNSPEPFVKDITSGDYIKLHNLHIHSKQLEKWQ